MAKNFRQVGSSITISGVTSATIPAGSLYRRTGLSTLNRGWIGVVEDEIVGSSVALQTLDGRSINIGDGVAGETQFGTGKGDMTVEGVFTFRLPASGTYVVDGAPIYGRFTSNVASGVTDNVLVASPYTQFGAISGALVGFSVGNSYVGTVTPFVGMNVVDVKLLGLPMHGFEKCGPAQASAGPGESPLL